MEMAPTTHEPANHARILIVDDEPPLLRMMSVYLRRLGYMVTTLDSTEQVRALTPAEMRDFAIAVLDCSMMGIPEESLASELLAANGSLRIVAASGYPVDLGVLEAVAPGRVAFLHKPFTPEMLAVAVRRMIAPKEEKRI